MLQGRDVRSACPAKQSNPLDVQIQPGAPSLLYFPCSCFTFRLIVSEIRGRSFSIAFPFIK